MKISILILSLCLLNNSSLIESGYLIKQDQIIFIYNSIDPDLEVFVSGNFNQWTKADNQWKMRFNKNNQTYELRRSVDDLKSLGGTFYEFTFRVNNNLVDADPSVKDVIFCAGYGHRYVINWN